MNSLESLSPLGHRILLLNSHAHDIRLPWPRWHQPTGLLQVGAALQRIGCDVRLIDCLNWDARGRVRRRKVERIEVEGQLVDLWRFGGLWGHIMEQVWAFKRESWLPDQVFISCSQTTWWQAAQELIQRVKQDWFPATEVLLGGIYPSLEQEHARLNTAADRIIAGSINEARDEVPDLALYPGERRPLCAGIYLYRSQSVFDVEREVGVIPRSPEDIAKEITEKVALGVTEFAFVDQEIRSDQREHFIEVLREIVSRKLKKARFVGIANISPTLIDDEVAHWMGKTGYQQIYLKCDVAHQSDGTTYIAPYEVYQSCVDALHREAKFRPRHGDVTAMLLVGNPYEDIEAVTERLMRLASIVGSVNLVQYQYSSGTAIGDLYTRLMYGQNGYLDLTTLNCKLYPLARLAGNSFDDYMELTRLAALLNSKFRSRTFDFLGDGIVSQLVQESFRVGGWEPFDDSAATPDFIPLVPVETKEDAE